MICGCLLVVCGGLWLFPGGLWSFAGGLWLFAGVLWSFVMVCGGLWSFAGGLWSLPVLVTTNVGWFLLRRFVDLLNICPLDIISRNHSNTFLLINPQKTKSCPK